MKLTQFSPGAGCGCKISPKDLAEIIGQVKYRFTDPRLLVGAGTSDDAAVYDLGNGIALISTTDFFTPIVDDPYDFGYIAAVNAMSDIYAMGGKPVLSIALLGWPLSKLPKDYAAKVLEGAGDACEKAGISIGGGHSIDIPVPVFGLAVNGIIPTEKVKKNCGAEPGCTLYLTKPLGIGLMTTAQKRGLLNDADYEEVLGWMKHLNKAGEFFGNLDGVMAMTDVTGFGLAGHLIEMCEGSNVGARVFFDRLPLLKGVMTYVDQNCSPGGTSRNFNSYGVKLGNLTDVQKAILCDPQTSGGLLVATSNREAFETVCKEQRIFYAEIGETTNPGEPLIQLVH